MLLLHNAKVDARPEDPARETIAIEGGRIVAVGPESDLSFLRKTAQHELDLGGRRVIPGLLDGHAHVVRAGLTWTRELHWDDCASLSEALDLIAHRAHQLNPGSWIPVVGGWHQAQFTERRGPTKSDLDRVAPDHPCYVQLLYDEAVLNSRALADSGLGASGGDIDGGQLERDSTGEPTGVIRGPGAFRRCLTAIGEGTHEEQVRSTREMMRELAGYGLTGALDPGGIGLGPDAYKPLYEVWRRGEMAMRLRLYLGAGTKGAERREIEDWLRFLPRNFGDDQLRVTGIGEIILFRCWDGDGLTPFEIDRDSFDEFTELSRLIAQEGWPMHVHAVTDESVGAILDAWEAIARRRSLVSLRFSLAHADAISEPNLQRARALGLGLAVQNRMSLRAVGSARVWGEAAVAQAPPLKRMVELGFPLSGGTDATVVSSINPWRSLRWLVTGETAGGPRRAQEHRVSRRHALDLYSHGSAWFTFEENRRGRLAPGYLADLAVLSADYFAVEDTAIPHIRSVLTMVGGKAVHETTPFAGCAASLEVERSG